MDSVSKAMNDPSLRAAILSVMRSRAAAQSEIDKGLTIFGTDVFRRETSLFDPNEAGPVPPTYRLGPGDQLALILTGDIEQVYELPITREGSIFIPNIGAIRVSDLTIHELNELLYARLARVYSGMTRTPATTHFQVTVANLGTIQVSVLGDVQTPGSYKISKLGTVLTALYASGGPTEVGSMRQVRVLRNGAPIAVLDLYDYLITGNATKIVGLESGDVVFVPPRGPRVQVSGAATRPATYELVGGETLGDAIRLAGGFRAEADRRRVQLDRIVPPNRRTAAGQDRELVDVTGPSLEDSREPLRDGDIVHVTAVAEHVANRVTVRGNVWAAGSVAFVPGMKLSEAIARSGGIKTDTYEALQISRRQPDESRRLLRVRVPGVTATVSEPDLLATDITLQPEDEIRVFSLTEYRPARTVSIDGAVKAPSSAPFAEGMTLRDLVMLGGGLAEGALLSEAEIARMPDSRAGGTTATVFRVPLDSTYLLERRPDGTYLGPPGLAANAHGAADVVLKPYDHVLILSQPDFALPRYVTLTGEVRYPGKYALRNKRERLSDIIEHAGGLTTEAYPEGVNFQRSDGGAGRIGIDLPKALRDHESIDNLLLRNGDVIDIPVRSAVVKVTGAVISPVVVPYVSGADIDYYVDAAGGLLENGDKGRVVVTQPNGRVERTHRRLTWVSKPTPQPGSVVLVPEKKEGSRFDPMALLATATTILTSVTSAAAIIAVLRR